MNCAMLSSIWRVKELFSPGYDYVDRPTEVEAYRYTVKEAKRALVICAGMALEVT